MIDRQSIPQRHPDYILEQISNDFQLRHRQDDQAIFVSHTTALVWELINGERTLSEVAELIVPAYPNARDRIMEDLTQCIDTLRGHGAIEVN